MLWNVLITTAKRLLSNKLFLFVLFLVIAYFSHYLLGDDNPIEQAGESIIKDSTGQDIDFTPGN